MQPVAFRKMSNYAYELAERWLRDVFVCVCPWTLVRAAANQHDRFGVTLVPCYPVMWYEYVILSR